jgi:hypothetical protein
MKTPTFGIAALAAMLTLAVSAAPSAAGQSQSECWSWYHHAWAQMQAGNHKGYDNGMRKFNKCMNAAWEGPVPKKKKRH